MEKENFSQLEPRISSDESQEHKFLITSDGQVYISEEPVDKLTTLTHRDWLVKLKEDGVIDASQTEEKVRGGYIKKVKGKIMYWGESTTPIKDATEQKLFDSIVKNGALFVSAKRRE